MIEPKDIIQQKMIEIEKEHEIKVLFAIENGSRNWGIESKNSDYDVRFVYKRSIKEYLKINKREEVIMQHYDAEGKKCPQQGCYYDIVGFDIYKFSKMLSSSNPQVIEWLTSKIIYCGERSKTFTHYALTNFNPISLYYHYKSMCKSNYEKYIKSYNEVTYKKYLYAMRGLINAKFVQHFKEIPPIDFPETIQKSRTKTITDGIANKMLDIIRLKKEGKEKDIIGNIPEVDNFIEEFLKKNDEMKNVTFKKTRTDNELQQEIWNNIGVETTNES